MANSTWCTAIRKMIADAKARNVSRINLSNDEFARFLKCLNKPKVKTSTSVSGGTIEQLNSLLLAYAILLMVTAILGAFGNSAVIAFYGKKLRNLSPWKFLVLHLACCDFLFAIMQVLLALPALTNEIGFLHWRFGVPLCKISRAARVLGSMIAVQNILIIAIERYKGILNPLGQHGAKKRIKMALFASWLFGLASCIPILLVAEIDADKNGACDDVFDNKRYAIAWYVYLLVIFGLIPLLALGYLYGRIIASLRNPSKANAIFNNLSDDQVRKRQASEARIIKMLIAVFVLFFLCVLPTRITELTASLIDVEKLPLAEFSALVYCGNLTYPLHVAVNPIIYGFMDKEFRKALVSRCTKKPTDKSTTQRHGNSGTEAINITLSRLHSETENKQAI